MPIFNRALATKETIVISHFHNPVSIRLGAGSIEDLPAILNGRSAFLVTFPEAKSLGLLDRLQTILGDQLLGFEDAVTPNPDVEQLKSMYARFWSQYGQAQVIIAVGGGSAIDTAKALMVGTQSGSFDELIDVLAKQTPIKPVVCKSLIAVPTTAGTGSEVTPWATIWDKHGNKKYSLQLEQTWPEVAVIDPDLMLSLPYSVTLQSGLDALSHALESIWNRNANPISDTFAVAAAREVMATLPFMVKDLKNKTLRAAMSSAALKAGLAFSNTKTALAHSISYEMTLLHGIPHGIACSFTLPLVLRKAIGIDPDRDRVLSMIFDCPLEQAPNVLQGFLSSLGVATEFSAYGVSALSSEKMIQDALQGVRGKNFIGADG